MRTLLFPFGKTAELEVALICFEKPTSLAHLMALVSLEQLVMAEPEVTARAALEPQVSALIPLKPEVMAEPHLTAPVALEP